jgi:hypothetical protein
VAFRLGPGSDGPAARLLVDGEDVTEACAQRIAPTFPPSRMELLYTPPGGWAAGVHEAAVLVPGEAPDAWSFRVG